MRNRRLILICLLALLVACGGPAPPPADTATAYPALPAPTRTPAVYPAPTTTTAATETAVLTPTPADPIIYTYRIVNTYPHDPAAFTQGLVYADGDFYEGTGLVGESTLRRVDPETGTVEQMVAIPEELFGEGITLWQDRIIQLTWRGNVGFIYDRESFELLDSFNYPTEGWGITHDGQKLIMSDGTDTLYFWDPETLAEIGRVQVRGEEGPLTNLNELEYIEGEVWANVWLTDTIVRIDPDSGRVTGRIDLAGLLSPEEQEAADVLNGIAYDGENGRLFVTGKWWPKLFEIELIPRGS